MPLAYHFREKMLGSWDSVRGFLVGEFDFLFIGLTPLSPLSDGLSTLEFAQTGAYPQSAVLTTDVYGDAAFTVGLPAPLQFQPQLTVSPIALAPGLTHNYNDTGVTQAAQIRLVGNAGGSTLTGLQAPLSPGGMYKLLVNIGAPTITLAHQHTGSSAGNRFNCPGSVSYLLPANTAIWVWLDAYSRAWQIIGK